MIIEYTEEEKKQLTEIDIYYAKQLDAIDKEMKQHTENEPIFGELQSRHDDLELERMFEMGDLYDEFEEERFDQLDGDPDAILEDAKKQIDLIIRRRYDYDSKFEGFRITKPDGNFNKDAAIKLLKSELHLHQDALRGNYPEHYKALREYMNQYLNDSPFIVHDKEEQLTDDDVFSGPYSKMISSKSTNDFVSLSKNNFEANKYTGSAVYTSKSGGQYIIKNINDLTGGLSTSAKKILYASLEYLTRDNFRKTATKTVVYIPLKDYAAANGKNIDTDSGKKEFCKNVRHDLHDIREIYFPWEEIGGKKSGIHGGEMQIISNFGIIKSSGTDLIRIRFDEDAAQALLRAGIMQFPNVLYKHDNRNSNGFAVGYSIAFHNSYIHNISAGTADTLRVKSLLADCPDIVTTYEELKEVKGRRDWKEQIKKKLEAALDSNIKIGYLKKWQYRDSRTNKTYTSEEAKQLEWSDYNNLCVDYVIAEDNHALEEYIKEQKEQKALADEKKAKKSEKRLKKNSVNTEKAKKKCKV